MKRWNFLLGIFLVLIGLISLLNQIFPYVRFGRFVGPLILIGLGVVLILRPRLAGQDVQVHFSLFGDIRMQGDCPVTQHEYWSLVGSNHLDFTDAVFPAGGGIVRLIGLVNEVKIILPDDVGLQVESIAVVTESSGLNGHQERFFTAFDEQTANYLTAEKRVNVQSFAVVSEIVIKST